jgi:hypothetical protein
MMLGVHVLWVLHIITMLFARLQAAIDAATADYDLIEGFNYNLSSEDFTIK